MNKQTVYNFLSLVFAVLFATILYSCCMIDGYESWVEKQEIKSYLISQKLITGKKDLFQINLLRNFIHYTKDAADKFVLPLTAIEFNKFVHTHTKGTFCSGKTFLLLACLECLNIPARTVGMYTGNYTPEGMEYSHSVLEVYVDGKWIIEDTAYNMILVDNFGNPLNAVDIILGIPFHYESNEYASRLNPDDGAYLYADYFLGRIKYCEILSVFK